MNFEITYAQSAVKTLRKMDRTAARRVLTAIEALSRNPRPQGCVQLSGGSGEMRIRVGDYRVIYEIQDEKLVVLVLRLGHRREIYR